MLHKRKRMALSVLLSGALVASFAACRGGGPSTPSAPDVPIIFVHGFYGSGDQYRAMALYFASNGYPAERIRAFDHNSVGGTTTQRDLNAFIDRTRQEFGASRVHLVGHSMGTMIVNQYMGNTSNRSKVDKYVLVDGIGCSNTGRPCISIAASSMRATAGGNQTHVEAVVSPESFSRQYQHFLGRAPSTTTVQPATGATVRLAGRVQEFVQNSPYGNIPVRFWELNPDTGHRVGNAPAATVNTGADGFFGPVTVPRAKPIEVEVERPGQGTMHSYYQPFVRDDLVLRLNIAGPSSGSASNTNRGPNHSAMAIARNREFWHNRTAGNDELSVETIIPGGGGQPAADLFSRVTGNQFVGIHVHDDRGTPGRSTLEPLDWFRNQPFQTGVDVFMPAANPPNGTIRITNIPRGDRSKPQVINVPNWQSSGNGISVHFNDWVS